MGEETGVLIGVGVGPGDPDLITVKAVQTLLTAGTILVPATESSVLAGRAGRAETIVAAQLGAERRSRIRRVVLPMREPDPGPAVLRAAGVAVAELDRGVGPVVFATLGDPSVYSTFSAVARAVTALRPQTTVLTVPGIMAMQDLAARTGVPLCEGSESLTLVPVTAGAETYRAALASCDTVVAYKAAGSLPAVVAALAEEGRLAHTVAGCELGLPGERILPGTQIGLAESVPYLTTVVTRRAPDAGSTE